MYQKFPYKFNQLNIKNYPLIILISFHLFLGYQIFIIMALEK